MKRILSLCCVCGLSYNIQAQTLEKNPNIIMIVVDDMGYSDFGCYGSKINRTPNIDRLAAEGIRFTDFHTNGALSSPTRAALMTGRYQQYYGVEGVITAANHREYGLDPSAVTVAKLLRSNNYETVIYGKWHLGYPVRHNPIHLGFNEFVGYISGNVDYFSHIDQEGYEDWRHQDKLVKEEGYTTNLVADYAVRFLKRKHEKPFFLYLPFEACHGPWQGPGDKPVRGIVNGKFEKYQGREDVRNVYTEMVESLDYNVGRIMDTLRSMNLDENTIILFFSDNGGANLSDNSPWSGGKGSLLEGGHRVSSIARFHGKIKPGQVSDETIMTIDVLPTLCELTSTPLKGEFDGVSFLKTMMEGKKMPERMLFWRTAESICVRDGKWKLTVNRKDGKKTLIDLSMDIKEKNNLTEKYPKMVNRLLDAIKEWENNFKDIKQFS